MQISTGLSGLASTAAAIQRGQARFDAKAQRVVDDATAMGNGDVAAEAATVDGDPAPSSGALAGDLVSMNTESFVNQLMFGVYRKQQEQSQDLLDIVKPKG